MKHMKECFHPKFRDSYIMLTSNNFIVQPWESHINGPPCLFSQYFIVIILQYYALDTIT